MKKILFINTRLIYPATGGRKVVLYNYCKGLNNIYNNEIDVITFLDSGDEKYIDNQPNFINIKKVLNQPNFIEKIYNLIFKTFLTRRWPIQVSLFYSKKNQAIIDKYIENEKPNIIICDMVRTAQYLVSDRRYNFIKILDMDDLISRRYDRQLNSHGIGSDALGAYASKTPKFLQKLLNIKNLMRFILKYEYLLLKRYEVFLKDYFDKYIFVSPVESKVYNEICKFNKADFVTIGVDYEYYSKNIEVDKKHEIVFLGNMNVSHNKKAVEYFLKEIYPLVLQQDNSVTFKIVGKCDDKNYVDALRKNRNVILTGEVEDIRPYIKSSKVSIAYLTYGSGIKTKILETMAMGVPVVTNSIGEEGLIKDYDSGLYVSDDVNKVAKELVRLLRDEKYNEIISEKSKKYIKHNYQWNITLKRFDEILSEEKYNE